MRGKPGTSIVLTVLRKGETKPLIFNLVRAIVKSQSVKGKLVEPNYAYVRVAQFQEHTGEDLAKLLKIFVRKIKCRSKVYCLILEIIQVAY